MREQNQLPDYYWEPQPDEEDIAEYNARFKEEYEWKVAAGEIEEEELPFV